MKTKVAYYAEKLAKGQLSAYSMSKHFSDIDQLKKALRLADIFKEFYSKMDSIYDEWNHYLALIEEELDRTHIDYYDYDYYEHDCLHWEEVEWPDEKDNTITLPSDRELWILRQARNAAHSFPVNWPYGCINIPEEAWKTFFNRYNLSMREIDMFWTEYYLTAQNIWA